MRFIGNTESRIHWSTKTHRETVSPCIDIPLSCASLSQRKLAVNFSSEILQFLIRRDYQWLVIAERGAPSHFLQENTYDANRVALPVQRTEEFRSLLGQRKGRISRNSPKKDQKGALKRQ